jgi:HEAT repeat protein
VSGDAAFDELWRRTREMLTAPPSPGAAAEATSEDAEARAIDLDRVPEDPPERIDGWLQTIAEPALRQLDLALLLDLLRVEDRPRTWRSLAMLVTAEIERRLVLCDLDAARQLAAALAATVADPTCAPLHDEARDALERLATGPLVPRVVTLLAAVDEDAVAPIVSLCHTVGALLVHPFAEALAIEENVRAVRRLREMLLGFGAAGRVAVEQLQSSPNPMVRRTAVDLLRVFGGHDALPELATMLDDPDPQVQREAIRAIVQIATPQAHAIVERVLVVGGAARRTAIDELIALGDDKSIPLLCYLLAHTHPRGALARAHAEVAEALGQLSAHPDTIAALGAMLRAADWWAPLRTAMLRRTAAAALSRIGTADALAMLELAANRGPRGARRIARTCLQRRSGQP